MLGVHLLLIYFLRQKCVCEWLIPPPTKQLVGDAPALSKLLRLLLKLLHLINSKGGCGWWWLELRVADTSED